VNELKITKNMYMIKLYSLYPSETNYNNLLSLWDLGMWRLQHSIDKNDSRWSIHCTRSHLWSLSCL